MQVRPPADRAELALHWGVTEPADAERAGSPRPTPGERGLAGLGPVPGRAGLGHGPGGLQRPRHGLGLLPPRPRPLPGVPVERGRAGRHLRRPADVLLRAGAVERRGPDPQGADLRPRRRRRQPRRGRQGVLVVPGLHARPTRGCAGATTTRRRAFPYDDLVADNARARPRRARVRAGRHRHLRRGPVLGGRRRLRQGRADRHVHADHRRQPRPGAGHACTCCRRCGSATPGRGGCPAATTSRRSTADGRPAGRRAPHARPARARRRRHAAEPLVCDNETNAQRLWGLPGASPYPKDGINDHVVDGADTVNPAGVGTKAALHYRADRARPGASRRSGCGSTCDADPVAERRRAAAPTWAPDFDAVHGAPAGRGRRVLRRR